MSPRWTRPPRCTSKRVGRSIIDPRVRFVHADVFSWKADSQYDLVFFANWLSHVPPSRFDNFWETVGHALRPAGRVFFIDELRDAWRHEHLREDFVAAGETTVVTAHFMTVVDSES